MYLTVDWDYFIPEDLMWDFGHRESELFLNMMWMVRGEYIGRMKTTGEEESFWKKVRQKMRFPVRPVPYAYVSDSHTGVWRMLHNQENVVLFDAHHDCWEGENNGKIMCENWANEWLKAKKSRRLWWIRPAHSHNIVGADAGIDIVGRVYTHTFEEFMATDWPQMVTGIHICRSGCWTPPWLDEAFQQFVKSSGFPRRCLDKTPWDGWKPRWTPERREQAVKLAQEVDAMRKKKLSVHTVVEELDADVALSVLGGNMEVKA